MPKNKTNRKNLVYFPHLTQQKLEKLAEEHGCFHNGKPSVGKLLKRAASMILSLNIIEEMQDYKEQEGLNTVDAIGHSARKRIMEGRKRS